MKKNICRLAAFFAAAGIFYYVFNFIVAFAMEKIEKRLSYYK